MNMFKELHNEEKYWEEQNKIRHQRDIETGRKEERKRIIKNMLSNGDSLDSIENNLFLPKEVIIDIITELQNEN